MKRYLTLFLALMLCACAMIPVVSATEETEETEYVQPERPAGYCGEAVTWRFEEESGTLVLSGTGEMDDLTEYVPWQAHKEDIRTLILTGNLTYIGANAFTDYDALKAVNFGTALTHVGAAAFRGCDGLTEIFLPASFRRFGEDSFRSCQNLTAIYCDGVFPSFNLNCLWDTYTKIYYPADRPWGLTYIEQLESAFQGRIEFLADDGSDPFVPTLPEEETLPVTIPTEAVTEPVTVPTEAPTEETTVPTEEAPTEAPTAPPEPETEPQEEEYIRWTEATEPAPEKPRSRGTGMGIWIIAGILSLVFLGALIFRRKRWD